MYAARLSRCGRHLLNMAKFMIPAPGGIALVRGRPTVIAAILGLLIKSNDDTCNNLVHKSQYGADKNVC